MNARRSVYIPELNDQLILEHLQKIQRESQTALPSKLEGRADGYNLTIEMETDVGKTYTYSKTYTCSKTSEIAIRLLWT